MRLIIGGKGQGKRDYAASAYGLSEKDFADNIEAAGNAKALYAAHAAIAECLKKGIEPEPLFEGLIEKNPDIIIISDELGCGVVPIAAFDREWRERTGRILCTLAERAESVERVFCGIPMRLK